MSYLSAYISKTRSAIFLFSDRVLHPSCYAKNGMFPILILYCIDKIDNRQLDKSPPFFVSDSQLSGTSSPIHTKPEKFQNGVFTLKTHQMLN